MVGDEGEYSGDNLAPQQRHHPKEHTPQPLVQSEWCSVECIAPKLDNEYLGRDTKAALKQLASKLFKQGLIL